MTPPPVKRAAIRETLRLVSNHWFLFLASSMQMLEGGVNFILTLL